MAGQAVDRCGGSLPWGDLSDVDRPGCAPLSSQQRLPVLFVQQLIEQVDDPLLVAGAVTPIGEGSADSGFGFWFHKNGDRCFAVAAALLVRIKAGCHGLP